MALYLLKFPYRKLLLPLAKKLKFINPDIISYAATVVAGITLFCYLFANRNPALLIWSIGLTLLRMTLNTMDGVIAIERGNLRLKGEIVNALPDRYSDIFIISGIALSPLCSPVLGVIGLSSMFLVSYTGILGKAIGVEWQHHGPLGKVERLIILMIFSLLQYLNLTGVLSSIKFYGFDFTYLELSMIIFLVLGQITVFNRLKGQLREAKKLEWEKYKDIKKKTLVIFDSNTGNTEKVAQQIAQALDGDLQRIDEIKEVGNYDLVIFGSPNIRKEPTEKIKVFLDTKPNINNYSVFITSGMPIWRIISTAKCFKYFKTKIGKKPITTINIKGYHSKYKTCKGHPNSKDLLDAYLFSIDTIRRLTNV